MLNPFFLSINYVGVNKLVYSFLEKLDSFQDYYVTVCPYIAVVCVMMTIGMGVWKVMWDMTSPKEFFIKLFMTICMYFVMIGIYPVAMKGVMKLGTSLGYGAIYQGGNFDITFTQKEIAKGKSKAEFYRWLTTEAGMIFATDSESEETAVKNALNFNLIDRDTGYIDLNKLYLYPLVFGIIMIKYLPKYTAVTFFTLLPQLVLMFASTVIFVVVLFFVIVNYVMALLDYFALCGFGILMVPLSLWEGTKDYTQKLFGSIGQILIKLMVISAVLFLDVMCVIDAFVQIYKSCSYISSGGAGKVIEYTLGAGCIIPMCFGFILQSVFMYAVSKETSAIAGFITGGAPRMSFGEFANAASQMVRNAGAGASMGSSAANGVSNGFRALNSAGVKGSQAFSMAGGMKGGFAAVGSGLSVAGVSLAGSVAGSVAGGAKNLSKAFSPSGMRQGMNNVMGNLGLTNGISQEGFGSMPFSPEGGSSESGGISGNGQSDSGVHDMTKGNEPGGTGINKGGSVPPAGQSQTGKMSLSDNKESYGNVQNKSVSGSEGSSGSDGSGNGLNVSNGDIPEDYNVANSSQGSKGEYASGLPGFGGSDTSKPALQVTGDAEKITRGHQNGLDGVYGAVDEKNAAPMDRKSIRENPDAYMGGLSGALYQGANILGARGTDGKRVAVDRAKQWANLRASSSSAAERNMARVVGFAAQYTERRLDRAQAKENYGNLKQAYKDYAETGVSNSQAVENWNKSSGAQQMMGTENSLKGFFKDIGSSLAGWGKSEMYSHINDNGGMRMKTGNASVDNAVRHSGGVHVASVPSSMAGGERGRFALRANNGINESDANIIASSQNAANVRNGFEPAVGTEQSEGAKNSSGGNK